MLNVPLPIVSLESQNSRLDLLLFSQKHGWEKRGSITLDLSLLSSPLFPSLSQKLQRLIRSWLLLSSLPLVSYWCGAVVGREES